MYFNGTSEAIPSGCAADGSDRASKARSHRSSQLARMACLAKYLTVKRSVYGSMRKPTGQIGLSDL